MVRCGRLLCAILVTLVCVGAGKPRYVDVSGLAGIDTTCIPQLIATLTSTSPEVAAEIIALGAVSVRDTTSEAISWRKLCVDAALLPQQQLRIYHPPQRFPAAHVDWSERLLLLEEDYLIVNKPSNLPCMAHPSNAEEHLTACVKREYGLAHALLVHRLDAATSGAVLIARTREAQRYFCTLFEAKSLGGTGLEKVYAALTHLPAPVGLLSHLQYKKTVGAQILRSEDPLCGAPLLDGPWKRAQLVVLDCRPIDLDTSPTSATSPTSHTSAPPTSSGRNTAPHTSPATTEPPAPQPPTPQPQPLSTSPTFVC
ncbi:pseudouridine synthase [Ochromonadaceae sp. CCMP2298]|nr:pseudouridine synthase [Ochromonadaceae sp. CCMP2298]